MSTGFSYRKIFWTLAFVGFSLDLLSKYAIFGRLYNDGLGDTIEIIPGYFQLVASYKDVQETGQGILPTLRTISGTTQPWVNQGALFGMGQGNNLFFGIVSVAAAVFLILWSFRPSLAQDPWLCWSLGLILAGTLGNLFDRVVFDGVRDFLLVHYQDQWYWPTFNIADCCLVLGAGILLFQALFVSSDEDSSQASEKEAAGASS